MTKILLQTTIERTEEDWHIGRFSMLTAFLAGLPGVKVVARDRATRQGTTDPVLAELETSDFDQVWLFAVDTGEGLNAEECATIGRFRKQGGGLLVTRDHMDLGCSVCSLGGVGEAHHFHTHNMEADPDRQCVDDVVTDYISWPNYHSGANGDWQTVTVAGEVHPLLRDGDGVLTRLPSHPHEGAVSAPADQADARVIATGVSKVSGRPFNLAVAFEGQAGGEGRGLAQSTFHHFADYNWDPRMDCPSFVTEAPGDGMLTDPEGLRQTHRYMANVAGWLSGR
jgi:hypothetical protein